MTRAARALAIALLLGCASDEKTDAPSDAPRGPRYRAPVDTPGTTQAPRPTTVAPPPPATRATSGVEKEDDATPEKKAERDYGAEMRTAIGDPTRCLKPRTGPDAPAEIRIEVDATVVEIGRVTRAYVRSPQLAPDELECVEQRVSALRMRAPVEEAPRSIRTTIVLQLQPAKGRATGTHSAESPK